MLRSPLSEALWFLWKDNLDENKPSAGWLDQMQRQMQTLGNELGAHSAFAEDAETLFLIADSALPNFSGGNGRYRYAKAVELSSRTNAVLTLAPRYENTAMILDMRGLHDACSAPLFQLSLDNDWDETAWSRLRSFLYYCLIWQTQRTRPVRPDGFFASVMKQKIAYSMTSSRLILNLPCAVTLCRPFLSKRKLSPAFSS